VLTPKIAPRRVRDDGVARDGRVERPVDDRAAELDRADRLPGLAADVAAAPPTRPSLSPSANGSASQPNTAPYRLRGG
jgi:hypothetical protein